jgi:hypothetical protein
MTGRLATFALVAALAGCGDDMGAETETAVVDTPTVTLAPEVEDLFRRYDALLERPGLSDDEDIRQLPAGDRALYVLWVVDGEINNGGLSQYLSNTTATLHDEAVASARLIGAVRTAALLERLSGVLGVADVPEDPDELQQLAERLTPAQDAELGELDEEWYAGISVEIERRLIRYVREHPDAFSNP